MTPLRFRGTKLRISEESAKRIWFFFHAPQGNEGDTGCDKGGTGAEKWWSTTKRAVALHQIICGTPPNCRWHLPPSTPPLRANT